MAVNLDHITKKLNVTLHDLFGRKIIERNPVDGPKVMKYIWDDFININIGQKFLNQNYASGKAESEYLLPANYMPRLSTMIKRVGGKIPDAIAARYDASLQGSYTIYTFTKMPYFKEVFAELGFEPSYREEDYNDVVAKIKACIPNADADLVFTEDNSTSEKVLIINTKYAMQAWTTRTADKFACILNDKTNAICLLRDYKYTEDYATLKESYDKYAVVIKFTK